MARAMGARAQMLMAYEATYGTAPATGFFKMPFARSTLGTEQPLLNSELLGYGRDPLPPVLDAITSDGNLVVPIDTEAFGFWLKGTFGAPTTTGTTPKTHTFQTGSWTLPSMSIEVGMPDVPRFAMFTGCMVDQLSWSMAVAVLAEAGLSYLGFGASVADSSWGILLADLQRYIGVHPLSVLWPGLAITLTVLSLNLLGDALREATDPTLSRRAAEVRLPEVVA